MLASAFELGEEVQLKTIQYSLHQPLWNKYDLSMIDLSLNKWRHLKYLNGEGTALSQEIDVIPADKGGLYMFYIMCPIIRGITEFPFYIGRAQLTQNQNLRKRVKEYFLKYRGNNERPKITRMFKYWEKDLYLCYLELDDNESVRDYEKKLINSLLLPMNDQIPDQEIRQAVSAFQ